MVVVPTSHDVTLTYGSVPADGVGQAVTVVSLAVVIGRWPWSAAGPAGRRAVGPAGRRGATR